MINNLLTIPMSKSRQAKRVYKRVYMNHAIIVYSFLSYGVYEGEVVYEVDGATL